VKIRSKPRVLVVDDSLTVRMDLRDAFVSAGFDVVPAATLAEARAAFANGRYAAVVLDVKLPDGDGVDFLREIKASDAASTRVLLLSTEAEVGDRVRGLKTGADEFVGKPYDASRLLARVREIANASFDDADATSASNEAKRPLVLVVEDGATAREAVRAALDEAGYRVETAETGEDGIRLATALRPDAVVLDGALPGIDGEDVLRRLRQDAALRDTPCVMLTASPDPHHELKALDAGADAYVRKGEPQDVLLLRIEALLRRRESPRAARALGYLGPRRVLAVDDSPTYLDALERELKREGYEVASARSGEEALSLLDAQTPDCILLDLVMPGLSGAETCRRIKASPRWRDVPLMFLTAHEGRESMIAGINAGADDYVPKSADFDVLRARLRAQLRRKQFEDETRGMREEILRSEMAAAETRAARDLAEARAALVDVLERKNSELEAFAFTVSHDLRAPLRVIDGNVKIIEEDYAPLLPEEGLRRLAALRRQSRRMSAMIEGLLNYARTDRLVMSPGTVDMTEIAATAAEEAQAAHPHSDLDVRILEAPRARADRTAATHVLKNLLSNAVKYSARKPRGRVEFGGRRSGAMNEYYVSDEGVGFDPEYAHKLFGAFQRLHGPDEFEGAGVGLAIVRRLVERHGGRIQGEGRPGKGAVFRFTLPAEANDGPIT
jgi:two-component system, NtrC family, sensor kinase